MSQHGNVNDHLVVNEFITLGHIANVVKPEDSSPPLVAGHSDFLELTLLVHKLITLNQNASIGVSLVFVDSNTLLFVLERPVNHTSGKCAGVLDKVLVTTGKLDTVVLTGLKESLQVFECFPWVDAISTSEKVSSGVAEFGPSVNAQISLSDDNNR